MRVAPAALLLSLPIMLAACGSDSADPAESSGVSTPVAVAAGDNSCDVNPTSAPPGEVVFTVTNSGAEATEFYVYAGNGTDVVSEVENIGPGVSRDLSVEVAQGTYVTACKPGMAGEGIRGEFTVE